MTNLLLIVLLVSAMSTTIQVSKAMTCRELWIEQSHPCKKTVSRELHQEVWLHIFFRV
ncbi:hypothetical protein AAHE18_09G020500 [Arachis hypogaea]|nr:uncharacterized protein DS421_9g255520 [Arachis hypogaea]